MPPRRTESLRIRAVRLSDLPHVRRMSTVVRLNQPEINLMPYSPLRAAMTALLPGRRAKPRFFVAVTDNGLVGFAQFQPAAPDQRWQLIALGAAAGVADTVLVWEELIAHATVAAGMRSVKRLYARVPADDAAADAVRAVGFAPYASETIYLARQIPAVPAAPVPRAQEQADTWAIHQLYNASVPRQVQYAEAFTSHRWDVRTRSDGQRGLDAHGWLIEDGHHVIGYARVLTHKDTHMLEVLCHPERIDVLEPLLDGVLSRLAGGRRQRQIYCAVRGYQAEVGTMLERRGFIAILEQDLHLKYTTANVRLPATETVLFHTEVKEKMPKRVPSYLHHGQPQDESAT